MHRGHCAAFLFLYSFLLCWSLASAQSRDEETLGRQAEQAGKLREALTHYVAALQSTPVGSDADQHLREMIIAVELKIKPRPAIPEDAERHMARGRAAVKEAKNPQDFEDAIQEFKQAVRTAPWLADGYYNLGVVQDKAVHYAEAIRNLKLYLVAAPDATDAKDVQSLIYEVEYRRDKAQKVAKAEQASLRERQQEEQQKRAADESRPPQTLQEIFASLPGKWMNGCQQDRSGLKELGISNGVLTYRDYGSSINGFGDWLNSSDLATARNFFFRLDQDNRTLVWNATGQAWYKIISADELEALTGKYAGCRFKRVP
jgi:tetratricopeptide (TPR) repeat protein